LRLVVPFEPGGANDIMVHGITPDTSATLGQQIVVDNRGGASEQIGAEATAKWKKVVQQAKLKFE